MLQHPSHVFLGSPVRSPLGGKIIKMEIEWRTFSYAVFFLSLLCMNDKTFAVAVAVFPMKKKPKDPKMSLGVQRVTKSPGNPLARRVKKCNTRVRII